MQKIKAQQIQSSALVSSVALLALIILIITSAIMHQQSSNITDKQLPFTLQINQLSEDVTESLAHLNSWVMLQHPESKLRRHELWSQEILPTLEQLKLQVENSKAFIPKDELLKLETDIKKLYVSQWWVEDVSHYIGNQPALVVYQQSLLPIYYHIHSSLYGVQSPGAELTDNPHLDTAEIRMLISNAHLLLTEAMHQLSQVILTGEVAYINRFKQKAKEVRAQLSLLGVKTYNNPDATRLLNWITQKYEVYIDHAHHIMQIRQASDWNMGLWWMDAETEPLTAQIKSRLLLLQKQHVEQLQRQSQQSQQFSFFALVTASGLFIFSVFWAYFVADKQANKMVRKITHLRDAANNIAQGKQNLLNVEYNDELDDLAKVFNKMQTTILRRRKKFVRERERLNEIIRIITHDIKAPLINIKGHADIICEDVQKSSTVSTELKNNLTDSMGHIALASARIDELITGILTFSEYMQFNVELKVLDLEALVDDLLEINSQRLENTTVEKQDLPEAIIADAFVIKFILSTLIDNAIKYQHPQRPLNLIFSWELDQQNELCYVRLKDNGLGISDKAADSVFKLFNKGEHNGGSGIGLSCARSMAEKLAGDIQFHNNPNQQGVCFEFYWHYFKTTDSYVSPTN